MKLCFSTYASILVKGKARTTTQIGLIRALFQCIPQHYDAFDDAGISDIVNGKKNVPDDDVDKVKKSDPRTVASSFKENILKMLDNNKKSCIVLALKDVMAKDKDLADDTKIEMVNGMTKAAFLQRDSLVYGDLLAGIFVYILIYTDNRGTRDEAKIVTDDYLGGFKDKADSLSFIESYSDADKFASADLSVDAHIAALLAETEGKCINCGRPIAVNDGTAVNRAKVLTLPDNTDIIVCADCERVITSFDEEKLIGLAQKQSDAGALNAVRDDVACEKLDGEIETVLRLVHDLDGSDSTRLKLDPVTVDKKVSDKRLRDKVRYDVVTLFGGVNDVLERLSNEHVFDATKFARQLKRVFEDTRDSSLSQRQVYDLLVEKLDQKSGGQYKTACEVIISYFVQRCEVFDEISE